jgi:hypothetical protein
VLFQAYHPVLVIVRPLRQQSHQQHDCDLKYRHSRRLEHSIPEAR